MRKSVESERWLEKPEKNLGRMGGIKNETALIVVHDGMCVVNLTQA